MYPQEYNIERHELRDELPVWSEPLLVEEGYMQVPSAPGLGVKLDEAAIGRMRTS
jgi:L-alanine-DL-glutamate epimerase-like enolase superfamily enzyme